MVCVACVKGGQRGVTVSVTAGPTSASGFTRTAPGAFNCAPIPVDRNLHGVNSKREQRCEGFRVVLLESVRTKHNNISIIIQGSEVEAPACAPALP